MASVLLGFRLVAMRRSVVNWRKIAFSSTCRNLASGKLFQRKCCSLLPASADNKRQQNEDRGKFYTTIPPYELVLSGSICTALWGSIHTECVGEDSPGKERMTSLVQVKRNSTTKRPRSWSVTRRSGFRQFKKIQKKK